MPLTRCVALVVCMVSLAGVTSSAFKPDYHAEITRDALVEVNDRLLAELRRINAGTTSSNSFTPEAVEEIVAANKAKDTGDCGKPADWNVPAVACRQLAAEWLAALQFLERQPAAEHFDNEVIQRGSDLVFEARAAMRGHLAKGNFVAARKVMGGALHAIQDFYAHTNFVEAGQASGSYETRLGQGRNSQGRPSFETGLPRLARGDEATCDDGTRVITPFLTSGYFFTPVDADLLGIGGLFAAVSDHHAWDIELITKIGKCRHGFEPPEICSDTQPGINKDAPCRTGYAAARQVAVTHTGYFIVELFRDLRTQLGEKNPKYAEAILGFLGYEPTSVISSFSILKFPPPPARQTKWDGVLEVFLNIPAVHPDIVTCVSADDGRRICSDECADFDWQNPNKTCRLPLGPPGFRLPPTGRILVEAWDIDPTSRQLMARGTIDVTDPCVKLSPHQPCEIPAAGGPLVIDFEASGNETARPSSPPGVPPPAPGPGGGAPPPARVPPAPEAIDRALGLRDDDNCTGADQFMPQGAAFARSAVAQQLGPDQSNRLYQAVAFAMSVTDQPTKQIVMNTLQTKVGDDAYYGAMTLVMGDLQQSRSVLAGYQSLAGALAGKVTSQGLNLLLPQPKTAAALVPDVDRWILKRLTTPALVADAVNMMFGGAAPISAECALNELAKDGFTDTINGR